MKKLSKDINVIHYHEIDSTNNEAKRLILNQNDYPYWVVADTQTSGRGRKNRYWVSPKGNFMGTYVIKKNLEKKIIPQISFVISLALCMTVKYFCEEATNAEVQLKWPNDLIINGYKCGGILIENMDKEIHREKIIGIGIGVNLVESPESVNFKASSLKQELKKHIDRDQFLLILDKNINFMFGEWKLGNNYQNILKEWLIFAYKLNKKISLSLPSGEKIEGIFDGLDAHGGLILVDGDVKNIFHAAEIYEGLS